MFRNFILVFLSCVLLAFSVGTIRAQDTAFTFDKAYSDYIVSFDAYKKAKSDYDLARLNYLAAGTLATQNLAETATLTLLQAKDEVITSHLMALRKKVEETPGIGESDKTIYYSQIDSEINWYRIHKAELTSSVTLANLVKESDKAKEKYGETTLPLMYKILGNIQLAKVDVFKGKLGEIVSQMNTKLGEIRTNGDKNTQVAERGLLDVASRMGKSSEKENEARAVLAALGVRSRNPGDEYTKFQTSIVESNQYLKEANNFMKNIITEIMSAD